ncbi:MAG: CCA tRNA nucleotidyltransferase, partial [Notoacmeibacter sp.]|nr:CCA tRNA nucleotidyltransferase [Notoacmeibacter sp.]
KALYRGPRDGISDRLSLALAARRAAAAEGDKTAMGEAASLLKLKRFESDWEKPVFPVAGADLVAAGMAPGPELGRALRLLEESWIESGFTLTRDALLARAKQPG